MDSEQSNVSQIYLHNILLRTPGSIYWKDLNGVYLGCNQMQADLGGLGSPQDVIGKTDYQLPWKAIANTLREIDQRITSSGLAEELIETPILPDGRQLTMITSKSPLYDQSGKIIGIIGTSLDITAYKKAEAEAIEAVIKKRIEEESKRAIMILAGSIVHDLRTPLSILNIINSQLKQTLPVLGESYQLIQDHNIQLSIKVNHKIDKIINDLATIPQKFEQIISEMYLFIDDNLKAIKRSTSNELQSEDLVECQSYKIIANALEAYPFSNNERQSIDWNRDHHFKLMGNPILLMRILFNLINNSLHQINQNHKGKIFISSSEQDNTNTIIFRDTAGGAPKEIVDHIFDGYITTKEKGTGVGLAFCKLTMNSFGGDINCSSVEGDYIEFCLTFPKL